MADWVKFNGDIKASAAINTNINNSIKKAPISPTTPTTGLPKSGKFIGTYIFNQNSFHDETQHGPDYPSDKEEFDNDNENKNESSRILLDGSKCSDVDEGHESEDESRRILEFSSDQLQDLGSQIRREARQDLQDSQLRRPSSLYSTNDDYQETEQLATIFNDGSCLFDSSPRILTGKNLSLSETSTEKLVNGTSPKEDRQVLHVQFNHRIQGSQILGQKLGSSDEKPHPSPSISTSSSSSSEDNSSLGQFAEARPPDGGWGWVVVAASFMVNLIADGITFSFGVIFVEFLNYFGEGKAKTAWIGSLFMAMPLLSGPIASFLTDRYGCRRVTIAGSILATMGFVISSFANSMWVLIITFGIVAGFGLSLCFVAAVVIVAYYFDKKRSFATGLSVCGSGIGTFIFAPVTQYLLKEYGWRGTTLILAGLFLNLVVCGCLMRDLEWTTTIAKAKTEERRKNRKIKRSRLQQNLSGDSVSGSSSANTATQTPYGGDPKKGFASTNAMLIENLKLHGEDESGKNFSSLVSLPTFVKNGEKVPLEVLELLSTRKNMYNVLIQNYPSLLISSRSFSDSGGLYDQLNAPSATSDDVSNQLETKETQRDDDPKQDCSWKVKKGTLDEPNRRSSDQQRRLPTAYLKDIRVHRHSLTYRGAMLNINRYRLRASSCPDIYRNSMTTIAKTKMVWYAGLWEFWDLIVDMLDFSHFADLRFLLFSISNFLLHTWYDVPYVYLTDNAIEMGFSDTDASFLISLIGITNMCGEILLGWAGDRAWVNASTVYAVCMTLCGGVTAMIPLVVKEYYALCAISGAFGLFIAANYSLTSIILVEVITIERFTNAYGLLLLVQGVANLMGPPLAGWLYDITGSYDLSFYLSGIFIALSGMMLLVMPVWDAYRRFNARYRKKDCGKSFADIDNV